MATATASTSASSSNQQHLQTFDDDDEFQDACDAETNSASCALDLDTALAEAKIAVDLFFNNKFNEAEALMKPLATTSMYHSVGHSVFTYLEAMLTFEQQHIAAASEALKQCLNVCNRYRKKNTLTETIGKTFKKVNYDQYTDLEAHAELCSAEALLLKAMLTFIEDETLTSLIKGGMKIRNCFAMYKECNNILNHRQWESESSKLHFESGVRMGLGTFNLMISLLPARIIKLLEFIGFSGNKVYRKTVSFFFSGFSGNKQSGMQDLVTGSHSEGIRQVLCVMTLLGYNLIVCYVLSHKEGDLRFCDELLVKQLNQYPDGVWFLFFKGRLEFMKGNLDDALKWYKKSWKSQNVWPQFHHLCFWELLWVNCLRLDWRESLLFATYLVENSKWSRTIYTYQKASIMCMLKTDELHSSEIRTIATLMKEVPKYKQRIAGKSLPMEKFACKKTERFFAQQSFLYVPALELMYVWNLFKILGKHFHLADGVFRIVEENLKHYGERVNSKSNPTFGIYAADNKALLLLLKGACLRQMNSPLQATRCLEDVIALYKDIKEDHYLVPYAIVELALIYIDQGNKDQAILALEDAKKNYSGYSLESRLHFRIHTALMDLKGKSYENIPSGAE